MYAEFMARPILSKEGNDLIYRIVQEDNYSDSFPRQVLEITIPNSDLSKD